MKILKSILVVCVMIFPIGVYIYWFGRNGISENTEEWSRFGDYIGGTYSVIIAFVGIYLTYYIGNLQSKQNKIKNRVEGLIKQIVHMKKRNFSLDYCVKFQEDISMAKLDLSELLINKLLALSDSYLKYKNDGNQIDIHLEEEVLSELKTIYNG